MGNCEVILNLIECESPPGTGSEFERVNTRCFRCGARACRSCSDLLVTRFPRDRRVRICADCQESEGLVSPSE